MQRYERKKVFELSVDLAGGGTTGPINKACFLAETPPIDPDHPDEAILFEAEKKPTPRFTMTTEWIVPKRTDGKTNQSFTAQVGDVVVPSQVVRVETVHIPSNPTTITLYPKITDRLLLQIDKFDPKIRALFLKALQNPVTAAIFLSNAADPFPTVAVCVAHLEEEKPIWEENQHTPASTLVSTNLPSTIFTSEKEKKNELALAQKEELERKWILVSGIHIKRKIDAEFAQILASMPQDKLDWKALSPYVEPYVQLRRISGTGFMLIY